MSKTRPTKKQFETLEFLKEFIAKNGYSPSYREIMKGCIYTSVATVALHIDNLIKRGHVVKRSNSARSLEVVGGVDANKSAGSNHKHELVSEIEERFKALEKEISEEVLNEVYGHQDVARAYAARITTVQ